MSTFNQGVPGVATLINSSATILSGNAASANALTVRQFGGGNVFSAQTTTGSTALFVGANGNVGVGTNNPGVNTLQVTGNIYMGDGYRQFSLSGGNSFGYLYGCFAKYGDAIHLGYNFYNNNSTNVIPNAAETTSRMSLGYGSIAMYTGGINAEPTNLGYYQDSTGRIGIGTTNPGTALQVNGDQISVPSYITSPGTPYTTSQQFYFAFNGNLTDSQSGVTATATGPFGGYTNSAVRCNKSWYFTFPNSRVTSTVSQTVAFWFCPLEQSNQTVFSWANGAQTASMNMDLSPSQNRFNIYIATPTSWIVSALGQNAPPYKLGTWIHVALAVSTTSATLYFNGVQVDQQTGSYTSASSTLMTTAYVGANGDASQVRKFNGFLDELRIYNTTLSPTQILTLYNSTTFIANGMSGGSVLTNSIGVGVQTPLNSIDSSGSVALGSYAGANQAPNGGLICSGSVGIGTTDPSASLSVNGSVILGAAYSAGNFNSKTGPYILQASGFDAVGTTHTIAFSSWHGEPNGDNLGGIMIIIGKNLSGSGKVGCMTLSVSKRAGAYTFTQTINNNTVGLITFSVSISGNDIIITSDSDMAVTWTFIAGV